MIENVSGLYPTGVAVLIKPYEPERKGSSIIIPEAVQGRMNMVDNRAVVIAIGPSAWHDEPAPRAKVGDKVLVTQFAGFMATGTLDKELYRLVNDRDIFCIILDEGDPA